MNSPPDPSTPPDSDVSNAMYERIADPVFALDEKLRFTALNVRAEQVLQRSSEALLGRELQEGIPEVDQAVFRRELQHAMETQEPARFEAFYPPRSTWFEVRAYPSETGVTICLCDVTERVRQQNELQNRERALQDAYEVIADPALSTSEQIHSLLSVVRDVLGTDYGTLSRVHETAGEYVFEEVAAWDDATLEAGESVALDVTICERVIDTRETLVLDDVAAEAPELADRANDADWGVSRYLGAPVVVADEVYGTFCFYDERAGAEEFTDWEVTFVELLSNWVSAQIDRKQRERELEASNDRLDESNERLEQFAYAASHDLQEPLRMVTNYLTLLDDRYGDDLDEDGHEFLEFAVDGADRMRAMIDALLEYSRVETRGGQFEPVDLEGILADVREDLQIRIEESGATVTADALPEVEGDPVQLRQVFQNLLDNAIEYSGDGPPRVHVTAERDGAEWVVSVRDEGIGVDSGHTETIFGVFQRLHTHEEHAGTGIGLALCRRIVERHGGEIWVDSVPGEETTVSFTLPASQDRETG